MNCVDCQLKLEDFLYGELSEGHSAEVRAHLVGCGACSTVRDELERENAIFARFYEQTALEPTAELWQAISARIRTEPPPLSPPETPGCPSWLMGLVSAGAWAWLVRPVIWRQAAFAVLLIAISVSATIFFVKRSQQPDGKLAQQNGEGAAGPVQPESSPLTPGPRTSDERGAGAPGLASPAPKRSSTAAGRRARAAKPLTDRELLDQQIARAEREYRSAIRLLDRAIANRKDSFDPALVKQYESSLALIDNSIAASRRAFHERPGDLAAGQFLLAAYARKVELMQDLALR